MNTKVETTEAMRRFNQAVERADYLLGWHGDRLGWPELCEALMNRNDWSDECGRAAFELRDAAKSLTDWPHMPKIEPIEFGCPHSWRHTGTSSDGMMEEFRCRLCGKVEVK